MKRKILLLTLIALAGGGLHAQTVALPAASSLSATVPWSLPSNCTAANACQFQVYRIQGACPATLSGSGGWTLVATTAAQAVSYKDSTVLGNTQYCYDVEAIPSGSPSVDSGPSNAGQITTAFVPAAPVIGTITSP